MSVQLLSKRYQGWNEAVNGLNSLIRKTLSGQIDTHLSTRDPLRVETIFKKDEKE